HLGLRPYIVRRRHDLRTRAPIRVVAETGAETGSLLHQDRVTVAREGLRARRHEGDAMLRGLDFLGHADDQGLPPFGPNATTVCRSGAKNSSASAATSSAVSASTVRRTSSRLRYCSP